MVLISDSATSSIPDYAVRDISEKHSENLSLNSFNLLQSVLQKQLIQNTSEKKELTEAIQEGNKRIDYLQNSQQEALIKIIDNAPLAIWMGDKDERTVYANSLFAELVGYTKDEMQGMESFDFWSPESIATVQNNNEVRIQ